MTFTLYHSDCLKIMPTLPENSIDAIITDLPYGTTACEWDSIIPLEPMWKEVKRVLKSNGAFVTTASQPFTSALVMSNFKWFKWEDVWDKKMPVGFLNAKIMPLRRHENILIFGNGRITYNPQMRKGEFRNKSPKRTMDDFSRAYGMVVHKEDNFNDNYYPTSIIEISNANQLDKDHETQKPVALYEYLIRTYTNPGDTVLDICFGSGTTGVACVQTGRNFIGIELNQEYFDIGQRRIEQAQPPLFVEAPVKLLNTTKQEALAL